MSKPSSSPEGVVAAVPVSIEVNGLTVSYPNGHVALRDTTFSLNAGSICALVGINGSGKSTLFKAIMGLVRPVAGRVELGGMEVEKALKQNFVAYVPQAEEVDWSFPVNVWDVVLMGRYGYMNFMRIAGARDRKIAEESLARVGML